MKNRATLSRSVGGALAALSILFLVSGAAAEELRLELDPETTQIDFTLGATLHTVEGTAQLAEGHVDFDPASGAASGRIVIATASLETGHEGRDAKMHDSVLESATFATIVFEPLSVEGDLMAAGESRLTVDGTLMIHGDSHPLSFEVVVQRDGESLTARTEFEVPYVAWGMKDPSRFVVRAAKEVQVRIEAAGRLMTAAIDVGR